MPRTIEPADRWTVQQSAVFKYATKPTQEVMGREPTEEPNGGERRNLAQGALNEIQPEGLKLLKQFMLDLPKTDAACFAAVMGGDFTNFTEVNTDFYKPIIEARKATIGG